MLEAMRYPALLALLPALACSNGGGPEEQAAKPNIVILLADDLGWTDVGFHGGGIPTPNIDRIAAEGAQLNRYYVAPVCSPTRAGLMTGRYPIRFGAMRAVYPPWREGGMDTSEVTMADVLATAGYEHRGVFGKWHLGHGGLQYHPLRRGFTEFYGHYNGAVDYFTHEREGELDWHAGYESSYDEGYSTDLIAAAAVRFIETRAAGDAPFLCYVPFNAVHSPFQAKEEDLPLYADLAEAKGNWTGATRVNPSEGGERRLANRRILGAMTHALDQAVGRILDALDEAGIADSTFVLFSSDNGGVGGVGENAPLRGAKASVFEGGIRVAAAARWPGKIAPGGVIDVPLANIDILPTAMRIAGVPSSGGLAAPRSGKPLDGVDILDVLTGERQSLDRGLFNYIGQAGPDTEQISYMTDEWKLVVLGPAVSDESADDAQRQRMLFRIDEDMAEERDVAAEHPQKVAEMYAKIKEFRALQPADAVPPYNEGRESSSFQAPPEWRIPGDYPQ